MISKIFLSLLLAGWISMLSGQNLPLADVGTTIYENDLSAYITNRGSLFTDEDWQAAFWVPSEGEASLIWTANLWIGGVHDGDVEVSPAGPSVGNNWVNFPAGPLDEDGNTDSLTCLNWNRFWEVSGEDILSHIQDFSDNGQIDEPKTSILSWPGRGNPYFSQIHNFSLPDDPLGLAPFFDQNGNGVYEPMEGDYPSPPNLQEGIIPAKILWCVFNDQGGSSSVFTPLTLEIQQTVWALNCEENPLLDQTIFTSHRIINRDVVQKDSVFYGFATNFVVGCGKDDLYGSAPELNTVYSYNGDEVDGGVNGQPCSFSTEVPDFGVFPPVPALTFLNAPLSYATWHYGGGLIDPPPAMGPPGQGKEVYRFMTGSWRDGSPLVFGGSGYEVSGANPTSFAFPDPPFDPEGWSMFTEHPVSDFNRMIATTGGFSLAPGGVRQLDVAWSFHQDKSLNHLDQVGFMYDRISQLLVDYEQGFAGVCGPLLDAKEASSPGKLAVHPNPGNGILYVSLPENGKFKWTLFALTGQEMSSGEVEGRMGAEVVLTHLPIGTYWIRIQNEKEQWYQQIVVF